MTNLEQQTEGKWEKPVERNKDETNVDDYQAKKGIRLCSSFRISDLKVHIFQSKLLTNYIMFVGCVHSPQSTWAK